MVVPVGVDGMVVFRNGSPAGSAVDVVVDVAGWFATSPDGTPNVLRAVPARRAGNTVAGSGSCTPSPCARLNPGQSTSVGVTGAGLGVPAGATAVSVTVTAVNGGGDGGWLQVWPSGQPRPSGPETTSTVSFDTADTVANTAIVGLVDGRINIYAGTASADVIIDVTGYWAAPAPPWRYSYDGDGLRRATTGPDGTVTRYRWSVAEGLPMLVSENPGSGTETFSVRPPWGPGHLGR